MPPPLAPRNRRLLSILEEKPLSLDALEALLAPEGMSRREIVLRMKELRKWGGGLVVRVDRTCEHGPYAFPVYGLAARKVIHHAYPGTLSRGEQGRIIFLKRRGLSGSEIGRMIGKSRSAVLGVVFRHNNILYSDHHAPRGGRGESPRQYWDETKLTETWAQRKARLAKEKAARVAA